MLCLLCLCGGNETAECSFPPPPLRIVSLAPAMTEILFSLGLGERVVGVTTFSDHPDAARSKTKIGGMTNPSLEAIVSLKPDLVVMTHDGNPKAIADRLATLGIATYVFRARRLTELPAGIREMGRVLGARPAANQLAEKIEGAIQKASAWQQGPYSPAMTTKCKTALFVIWPNPLIVAGPGTILDDAMQMNGLCNIAADAIVPYPRFSLEAVVERQPDLILIGDGNNDIKKLSQGFLQSLKMLEVVQKGRICYLDDALYRPGPRIPEGMDALAHCKEMP
jgi:iron complex transport system substrate-binding protein